MNILAHRGLWSKPEEKNTLIAFERAFERGYGVETDIRDFGGQLVISHDIPDENSIKFLELVQMYTNIGKEFTLALNIKSDGIQEILREYLEEWNIKEYFVFDMSIPEQFIYHKQKFITFTRQSEFEVLPSMYEFAEGIWMDEFDESWISEDIIENHLALDKKLGVISPEIHGRDRERLWKMLFKFKESKNIMLCTDVPKEAEVFFNGKR